MTATAVVEILVVGIQTELWLALLACAFSPDGHRSAVSTLKELKEWAPLGTVLALALAYGLGVIVDRWADSMFPRTALEKLPRMRLTVMHKSEGLAKFLEYQRSRLRIARGTVFNVVMATGSTVVYAVMTGHGEWVPWVIDIGVATTFLTLYSADRINDAFEKRLDDAYTMILADG
jgi:hypothetical protein